MINFYKILFFMSLLIGTLISISSFSWMGMWMGLEINLLSIIPLMTSTKNSFSSEASLKYFITQALSSTLLLFSIIIISFIYMYNLKMNLIMMLIMNTALTTKMGAAPFHFWFPEIMEGLNWFNSMIMLTWQKIAPMIILMYTNYTNFYLNFIIIMSMIISGIQGINQVSLRKILAYSSINHIGWMLSSLMFMEKIWLYYFVTYSIISLNIILIFFYYNIYFLKQLFMNMSNNYLIKLFFNLNFLSLGGFPPLLGFMPKWLTIQILIQNNMFLLTIIMIIMTLLTLYFYTRITLNSLIFSNNMINYNYNYKINYTIMFLNFLSIIGLLFSTLMLN